MTTGEYLDGITRKLLERGYGDVVEAVGVAREHLDDSDRELSRAQLEYITNNIDGLLCNDENDCVELGIMVARVIESA